MALDTALTKARPAGRRRISREAPEGGTWSRIRTPEAGVALLCLTFIAITVWWLIADQRAPDGDATRHLGMVFDYREHLLDGRELHWFRFEPEGGAIYPPLVHLVGMLGTIGGLSVDGPVLAINLVMVPALAAGCYGVARVAFDRRAGLLAAVFALATPVVIGQLHLFMVDLPLAAMVAVSAWALLASDRFSDRRLAALAGVLVGLGMLTKQSFALMVGPLIAVILVRGGLRNWRNVLIFGVSAAVVALPWYVQHFDGLTRIANEATAQGDAHNPWGTEHKRFSLDNFAWYGWTLVNIHYFLPLTVLYLVGLVHAAVRWFRTRTPALAPELIVGSLSGYLTVALLFGFQDARYSIPSLVFVAALGVGWIGSASPRIRLGATVALAVVFVANTIAVNTGAFGRLDLHLPGGDPISVAGEHKLVLLADHGYTARKPLAQGRPVDILEAAKRDGVRVFGLDFQPLTIERFDPGGLSLIGRATGVLLVPGEDPRPHGRRRIWFSRRVVPPEGPAPCTRFDDGTGLYVFRGDLRTTDPRRARNLYCPL